MLCWFDHSKPLKPRGKYIIRHTTQDAKCIVKEVRYKLDISTLHRNLEDRTLHMNDMGRVSLRTTKPLFTDPYRKNRITGSIILIDEGNNNTVAAGMII
jgi:sulfate adenylyltransferase subunit 1